VQTDRENGSAQNLKEENVRKLLLATVAVATVSASAYAEPKRDILGLHPGMSHQEAMSAMAKICKDKPNERYPLDGASCSLGERQVGGEVVTYSDRLLVEFAVQISQQRPVHLVSYSFRTSAEISDLIKSLFSQYGFPCESRPDYETCYPTRFYRASSPGEKEDFLIVSSTRRQKLNKCPFLVARTPDFG